MNELIEAIPKPEIPEEWDYTESVDKSLVLQDNWKHITVERATEYWIAHEKLKSPGARTDLGRKLPRLTWEKYCEDCKIDRHTPLEWFKRLGWMDGALVQKHTGDIENYTPAYIIEPVRETLGGIDLDPASCEYAQQTIKATEYFTEIDNGLDRPWHGKVFLNPPYKMPLIQDFTDKWIDELPNMEATILLTNNNTDTRWFHKCAKSAKALCLTLGRINFYTPEIKKTMPTNGQAFFYYGDNLKQFAENFRSIGLIVRRNEII